MRSTTQTSPLQMYRCMPALMYQRFVYIYTHMHEKSQIHDHSDPIGFFFTYVAFENDNSRHPLKSPELPK